MTPTDPTPLTAERLATIRGEHERARERHAKAPSAYPSHRHCDACALLATLDARELDVERLETALADELVRVVRMESEGRVLSLSVEDRARRWARGIAHRLRAALSETSHE